MIKKSEPQPSRFLNEELELINWLIINLKKRVDEWNKIYDKEMLKNLLAFRSGKFTINNLNHLLLLENPKLIDAAPSIVEVTPEEIRERDFAGIHKLYKVLRVVEREKEALIKNEKPKA